MTNARIPRQNHPGQPSPGPTADPDQPLDVLVIGAGQAGLALGYYLRRQHRRFLIVDAHPTVGEVWRSRWDSLRLFTAAEYDALPGLPFPAPQGSYPGKDDVANYLQTYAKHFSMPVRTCTRVERLTHEQDGTFTARTTTGTVRARQVVVATGPFQTPNVPAFAVDLDSSVTQLHSAEYRRPDDLPEGNVLVVGGGNSGVQIADELARTGRAVTVAVGQTTKSVAQRPFGRDLFWWFTTTGLIDKTADSRIGRRFRERELVVGTTWRALRRRGIRLRPRAARASGRTVAFEDGTTLQVDGVVWCTGFRPEYDWIEIPGALDADRPQHRRGVTEVPGLAFLGLPWQHTRGSALLGFVQHDAQWLAQHLADCAASTRPAPHSLSSVAAR